MNPTPLRWFRRRDDERPITAERYATGGMITRPPEYRYTITPHHGSPLTTTAAGWTVDIDPGFVVFLDLDDRAVLVVAKHTVSTISRGTPTTGRGRGHPR